LVYSNKNGIVFQLDEIYKYSQREKAIKRTAEDNISSAKRKYEQQRIPSHFMYAWPQERPWLKFDADKHINNYVL